MLILSAFAAALCAILATTLIRQRNRAGMEAQQPTPYPADDQHAEIQYGGIKRGYENLKLPRSCFGFEKGAQVLGWPSTGGIYVLDSCDGVELDFLGLDRFNTTQRSADPADEDAHCTRMRKLGATWWSSQGKWELSTIGGGEARRGPPPDPKFIMAGWPDSGGVWVLSTTRNGARSKGVGCVANARDMDERCRLLEKLGAIFYQTPEDCKDLDF